MNTEHSLFFSVCCREPSFWHCCDLIVVTWWWSRLHHYLPICYFRFCSVCAAVSQFFWRPRRKTGTFRCDVCGKPFSNKANMQRHKVLHATVRDVYFCEVCSRPFSWKSSLERHKRDMHAALASGSGVQRSKDSSRAHGTFPDVRWHLGGTDRLCESLVPGWMVIGGAASQTRWYWVSLHAEACYKCFHVNKEKTICQQKNRVSPINVVYCF